MSARGWSLECSVCRARRGSEGLPAVCEGCGAPYLVRLAAAPPTSLKRVLADRPWTMWRYREWLPLDPDEQAVSLGEGGTPLLNAARLANRAGFERLLVKDESVNPTGSFKARGLSAAVTRARAAGATRFVVPTAGNAGIALAAYAARAGLPARVYAPRTTPGPILTQIRCFGAELILIDGHIGDCGRAARAWASESGAVDVSTLREPYRIEGKKTLGLELAEQTGWTLPDVIVYPTGGGTGLIGMWKAFNELRDAGWIDGRLPRMFAVQATGCAPVVQAFEHGADRCTACPDPQTVAAGLRVPGPFGDRLILTALRESGGGAVAVSDPELTEAAEQFMRVEGIDAAPEGGATLAGARALLRQGAIRPADTVVLFNTGAGWLYRA